MRTKLAMPDVAVKGAQALVAAAGGLQAVYRAMQEHQHGAEVQAQACLALSVVACDRPPFGVWPPPRVEQAFETGSIPH